ncbi:MAG TPA: hypothetical protein VIU64_15280, partial [Polyangia bacterium]
VMVMTPLRCLGRVTGDITVNGASALRDFSLSRLTDVGGAVMVENDPMLKGVGLPALVSVGSAANQSLVFDTLPQLETIDVRALVETPVSSGISINRVSSTATTVALSLNFTALTTVGGTLNISNAAKLSNLATFMSLRTVGGRLTIDNDAALTNTAGLASLQTVGNDVAIQANPVLAGIDLHALTSVGSTNDQSLVFDTLPRLVALDVRALAQTAAGAGIAITTVGATGPGNLMLNFASLTNVRGDLNVSTTANLVDFGGFAALTSVGGALTVSDNAALTSVATGLAAVATIGGNFVITDNPQLCLTTVTALRAAISVGGATTTTTGNKTDC